MHSLGSSVAEHHKGRASVDNTLRGIHAQGLARKGDVVHGDLPVAQAGDGDIGELASVLGRVNRAKQVLAASAAVAAERGQEDRDDGLGQQTCSNGVVHKGLDAADRLDGVEAQAKEAVLRRGSKLSGLGRGEADGLADGNVADADNIGTEGARGAGLVAVGDGPAAAVLLVGGGFGGVEAAVLLAGGCGAGRGGEPDVRGALLMNG